MNQVVVRARVVEHRRRNTSRLSSRLSSQERANLEKRPLAAFEQAASVVSIWIRLGAAAGCNVCRCLERNRGWFIPDMNARVESNSIINKADGRKRGV